MRNPSKNVRRARKAGKIQRILFLLFVLAIAATGYVCKVNLADQTGRVGTVTAKAEGIALSCGGEYDPAAPGLFSTSLPCGTPVLVTNPANGRKVLVNVTNQQVMFRQGQGRVADVSVATAQALGLNPQVTAALSLRPLTGGWDRGLKQFLPVIAGLQQPVAAPAEPDAKQALALTKNMLAECFTCGAPGMVAVAQVTLNRLDMRFNGRTSIHAVVYDRAQFSWTLDDKPNLPAKGSKAWKSGEFLAHAVLTGQLSGDLLAIQYLITKDADHYYAPDVIKTPSWGLRHKNLEVVPMANTIEVELYHRFFRKKGSGQVEMASNG